MATKNKEDAVKDFCEMIKKSWTWAKLTENERETFINTLNMDWVLKGTQGTYKQRGQLCNAYYLFFLNGLGYSNDTIGWRGE